MEIWIIGFGIEAESMSIVQKYAELRWETKESTSVGVDIFCLLILWYFCLHLDPLLTMLGIMLLLPGAYITSHVILLLCMYFCITSSYIKLFKRQDLPDAGKYTGVSSAGYGSAWTPHVQHGSVVNSVVQPEPHYFVQFHSSYYTSFSAMLTVSPPFCFRKYVILNQLPIPTYYLAFRDPQKLHGTFFWFYTVEMDLGVPLTTAHSPQPIASFLLIPSFLLVPSFPLILLIPSFHLVPSHLFQHFVPLGSLYFAVEGLLPYSSQEYYW